MLEAQNLTFFYQDKVILENFSLSLEKGSFTMLLGANGSGKSTALRLLGGFLAPQEGSVLVDGVPIHTLKHFERAQKIAVVPQNMPPVLDFTVREMVTMGRLGNIPRFAPPGKSDQKIVNEVMEKMEISPFADRMLNQLSGGERQRVILAQALAGNPDYLLLDEPTANIDPGAEEQFYATLDELRRRMTVITVSHDLGFVNRETDLVICVNRSVNIHRATDFTAETADEVYHHHVNMIKHDHSCFCHCKTEHKKHD